MAGRARGHKLTDAFIAKLKRPGPPVRDGLIPGLVIRPGKTKMTWELRIEGERPANIKLGHWDDIAEPLKAEAAWTLALETLGRHRRREPLVGPDAKTLSLEGAWPLRKADLERRKKSPASIEFEEQALARLTPKVRAQTLRELSDDPDIMLGEWERISAVQRTGGMATARVVRSIYKFIRKDRDQTLPERLPTVRVPITKLDPASKPVMTPDELRQWNEKRLALRDEIAREFWLFALLSGLRRGGMGPDRRSKRPALMWTMYDREQQILLLQQKGNKKLMVVLSKPMVECLERAKEAGERLYRTAARTYVFPNGGKGFRDGDEVDITIPLRSEDGKDVCVATHCLRRTYTSLSRVPEELTDRLLGHMSRKKEVMGSYNIDSARIEEYREIQEQISARLIEHLGPLGTTGKTPVKKAATKRR